MFAFGTGGLGVLSILHRNWCSSPLFKYISSTCFRLPYTPWYDRAPCDKRETLIDHSWNDLQPAVEASGSWEAYRVHGKHGHRGRRKWLWPFVFKFLLSERRSLHNVIGIFYFAMKNSRSECSICSLLNAIKTFVVAATTSSRPACLSIVVKASPMLRGFSFKWIYKGLS